MHYQGLVFRAHQPAWSFTPLSGEGAARHGGRFNPKGTPALYTSLGATVALAEYHQGFPHRPQPTTLCAYEVSCDDIVDLTDPAEHDRWSINAEGLACAWAWLAAKGQQPATWSLAERLTKAGIAAVIVPSFAPNAPKGGKNLVFWHWSDQPPHQVLLIDDEHRLG